MSMFVRHCGRYRQDQQETHRSSSVEVLVDIQQDVDRETEDKRLVDEEENEH